MTRLEKVLSMEVGHSKVELIFACCPHDFGIKDEAKSYKSGWGCKALSGCEKCWNKEVDDE